MRVAPKRRLVATIGLWIAITLVSGAARANADWGQSKDGNNIVELFNQRDYSWVPRAQTAVTEEASSTVDNENFAYARASCHYCRTVAVAVQVLVLETPSSDFQPTNAAIALNESCSYCSTFAYANQVVLSPLKPVWIDGDSRDQADNIREQIARVTRSTKPFDQMSAELDSLTQQLVTVIQNAIERSGSGWAEEHHRDVDEQN
jgi:hypothetical protein